MEDFIKKIIDIMDAGPWMWVLAGVIALVFVFGIIMTVIKKRAFRIGTSTAVATLLAGTAMTLIGTVLLDGNTVYFTLFIYGAGGILALAGGCVSMIVARKKKHCECKNEDGAYAAPAPVNPGYYGDPAPYDYTPDNVYAPAPAQPAYNPAPAQQQYGGYTGAPAAGYSAASPEVEALLMKINRIVVSGAPLPEMRETAMQLQRERAKPENKNNPDTYSKLNKALIDLLGVIQKK